MNALKDGGKTHCVSPDS